MDKLESLAPDENTEWHPLNGFAQNAVFAVAYARDCQVGESVQNAVWASVQGYEAVDYAICTVDDVDFNDRGAQQVVLGNALVQGELGSQLRDLTEAASCDDSSGAVADTYKAFRVRAAAEGQALAKAITAYPELMSVK